MATALIVTTRRNMSRLPQRELDGDFDDDVDGFAASSRRAEPPLADRGHGALIEAGAEPLQDRDVADRAIAPHDDFEHHVAGDAATPGFVGVIGLHLAQQSRWLDAAAWPERPAARAAAGSVADAGAKSFTVADALTGAGAAARSGALAFARVPSALDDAVAIAVAARCRDDRRDQDARGQRFRCLFDRLRFGAGGGTGRGGSSTTRRDASTRSGVTFGTCVFARAGLLRSTFRGGNGFFNPPPPPPPPGPGVMRKTMRVGSGRS